MIAAIATFVLCMVIVIAGYWAFVELPEIKATRALRRRLAPERRDRPQQRSELTRKEAPLSAVKVVDALLARSGTVVEPLRQTIARAALPVTVGVVMMSCALLGMVVFLTVVLMTSFLSLGVLAGSAAGSIPYVYVRMAAAKRLRRLEEQFPQAVDLIAVSLRAGHAFTSGLLMVAEEMAEPLGGEFRLMHDQQNYGKPLPDVLKEFTERVPVLDVRIFATAVLTQRDTGGNLAEILDNLSAIIRERFMLRRQVRTVSAHGRISGWVLASIPVVVAGLLFVIAPDHILTLVRDPLGVQILGGALALEIIGALAIRRIVNIEI